MKKWRLDILIDLYDMEPDCRIWASEPRGLAPTMHVAGVKYGDYIPWARFNQLIEAGDLEEVERKIETEPPLEGHTFIVYKISQAGKMALQSLPNFYRRAERKDKVLA